MEFLGTLPGSLQMLPEVKTQTRRHEFLHKTLCKSTNYKYTYYKQWQVFIVKKILFLETKEERHQTKDKPLKVSGL